MLERLVVWAGVGQLLLVAGSVAIPSVLRWREETAKLRPLLRQLFWTYAAYTLATNLAFGLVSSLSPSWLLDRTPLATSLTGFMTLYWGIRLATQFLYFDRRDMPPGALLRLAEAALVALFFFLTGTYAAACLANLRG